MAVTRTHIAHWMLQFYTKDDDVPQPNHLKQENILIHSNEHPDGEKFGEFVWQLDHQLDASSLLIMDNASYHCYNKPNDPTSYEKYSHIQRPIYFAPNITAEISPIDVKEYGLKHLLWKGKFKVESIWTAIEDIGNTIQAITETQVEAAWQKAKLCVD